MMDVPYPLLVIGASTLPVAAVGAAAALAGHLLASVSSSPARRVTAYAATAGATGMAAACLLLLAHLGVTTPRVRSGVDASTALSVPSAARAIAVLGIIWVVGTLGQLALLGRQLVRLRRIRRTAELLAAQCVPPTFRNRRTVALARGDVDSPCVIGVRNVMVIFPRGVDALDDALLAHELAHVARNDFAKNVLLSLTRAALWWHPGIHMLIARASAEREYACDEIAAQLTGSRIRLARALVSLADQRSGAQLAPAAVSHPLLRAHQAPW